MIAINSDDRICSDQRHALGLGRRERGGAVVVLAKFAGGFLDFWREGGAFDSSAGVVATARRNSWKLRRFLREPNPFRDLAVPLQRFARARPRSLERHARPSPFAAVRLAAGG
jgi:hypothetical protein